MVLISLILLINVVFLFTVVKRTYSKPTRSPDTEPGWIEPTLTTQDPLAQVAEIMRSTTHAPTASALANLIRALYLDQSTFTFNMLEPLPADMRALAAELIAAHLKDRYRADEWERAYEESKTHLLRGAKPSSVPS